MVGVWPVPVLVLIVQVFEFREVAGKHAFGPGHIPALGDW
jgi:hypothetical protein